MFLKMMIFKYLMDFSDYYTEKDLIMLNTIFSICDTKYEGYICTDKLFDIFEENDVFFKQEDRAYFLKVERIDYFHYLMSNFSFENFSNDNLKNAFNYFDLNSSNYIEFIDVKNTLLRNGKHIVNDDDITKIIKEASNNDKLISFENFRGVIGLIPNKI